MTRHSLILEFDTHDLLSHAVSLLLHESVLTDKLFLIELAEESQA